MFQGHANLNVNKSVKSSKNCKIIVKITDFLSRRNGSYWDFIFNPLLHLEELSCWFSRSRSSLLVCWGYHQKKKKEVSESHSVVSDSLRRHGLYSPWNSPGQNTGVGSLSLLQGIFQPRQRIQVRLHCRQILYQLSHTEAEKSEKDVCIPGAFSWDLSLWPVCGRLLPVSS